MIVDLGLPDQDGIDLILQLRKSGCEPCAHSFGETIGRRPREGPGTRRGRLPDQALCNSRVASQDAQSPATQLTQIEDATRLRVRDLELDMLKRRATEATKSLTLVRRSSSYWSTSAAMLAELLPVPCC
jgi:DNA-binding response OmpR family regulator